MRQPAIGRHEGQNHDDSHTDHSSHDLKLKSIRRCRQISDAGDDADASSNLHEFYLPHSLMAAVYVAGRRETSDSFGSLVCLGQAILHANRLAYASLHARHPSRRAQQQVSLTGGFLNQYLTPPPGIIGAATLKNHGRGMLRSLTRYGR